MHAASLRLPKRWEPSAVGVGALVGAAAIRLGAPVPLPGCPFLRLTGLWCPGCGLTRGTKRLLAFDLPGALSFNVFAPVVIGLLVYGWLRWWWPTIRGTEPGQRFVIGRRTQTAVLLTLVVFGIARNLPWAPFTSLAPG